MKPVNTIRGRVAVHEGSNIDTDQIVPARFLSRERRAGYGAAFFHDLRLDREGREHADFALNKAEYKNPKVLVILGKNFGCGSSREQAAWAVLDHGIECVIAQSFSDIFTNNSLENGLLTVRLPQETLAKLRASLPIAGAAALNISLEDQTIEAPSGAVFAFDFDPVAKNILLKGLTRIATTKQLAPAIEGFERSYHERFPWVG
jgi:3-isopropylmalate/(R)-2-methylmalate dehydratase small subunit